MRACFLSKHFLKAVLLLVLFLGTFTAVSRAADDEAPKEPARVLAKYEEAKILVNGLEAENAAKADAVARLRDAASLVRAQRYAEAETALLTLTADMHRTGGRAAGRSASRAELRSVWLEFLIDLIQKFLYLLIFAYAFSSSRYYGRMIEARRFTMIGTLYTGMLFSAVAIGILVLDFMRFGKLDLAVLDIAFLLSVLAGIFGGFFSGILAGLVTGLFRWLFESQFYHYIWIYTVGGTAGALMGLWLSRQLGRDRVAILTGALIGLLHGLMAYVFFWRMVPPAIVPAFFAAHIVMDGLTLWFFLKIVSLVVQRVTKARLESDLLKAQLLHFQAQMNPHFIFNSLNVIASFAADEKAAKTEHLIVRLAHFLRRAMKREEDRVTLKEEMAYVDNYCDLEKARFQDRLKFHFHLSVPEDDWDRKIPILVLQPLVENAVKHGVGKKEAGGTVEVSVTADAKEIVMRVRDDGVGMSEGYFQKILAGEGPAESGIGLKNIHERLVRIYGRAYGLQFEGGKDRGTCVTVTIPRKETG
ncbi:MAG: histidine kinase [Candidatus Omnitrophota bacterium]